MVGDVALAGVQGGGELTDGRGPIAEDEQQPLAGLTGADSFSGAEELAYDLQQHGRAVVVGERTRGGAHPRTGFRIHPHLEVTVPTGRPTHPVTGTNCKGTGVVPDLPTAAEDALAAALARLSPRTGQH